MKLKSRVIKSSLIGFFLGAFLLEGNHGFAQQVQKVDYLITGGVVFDGSLQDSVQTDIGITGDRIVYIGDWDSAKIEADTVIDARGLYVSPGFIDPHTHNDRWLDSPDRLTRRNLPSLTQGVTTVFVGLDGAGTYAVDEEFKKYEEEGVGTNVATFVGLSPVREAVLGKEDVAPDATQLEQMKARVKQGMEGGAFGLSTGLYYAPQTYARTDEVMAMAEVAQKYGGFYDTHMRSESNALMEAVEETLSIGETTGIPLMISHIKGLGPAAWGKSEEVIKRIEEAQKEGLTVFASQYPYIASHTSVKAMVIPSWAQSGGNEKMVERLKNPTDKLMQGISNGLALRGGDSRITVSQTKDTSLIGKSLHAIAVQWKKTPEEALLKLLIEAPNTSGVSYSMEEEDIDRFMKLPWVVTCSDGGGQHPRAYGSFARKIRKYALDDKKISMSQTINSSSGQTATLLGIKDRGFIKENYIADVVIFDPAKIKDEATFEEPELLATGISHVFVNGVRVIKEGKPTGQLAGKPIRRAPTAKN